MKARQLYQAAIVIVTVVVSGSALAHGAQASGTGSTNRQVLGPVLYTNAAYTHAISGAPNPAPEVSAADGDPIYVDPANGQAIYGYPGHARTGGVSVGR